MISASASPILQKSKIRKMSISRDLDQVADLIERCFPIHLDRDGQTYIREMRKTAREMQFLGWLSSLSELESNKASGFVWEEEGKIIGNLSLIPFKNMGENICLIANVAVDPGYRRSGIARALTNHALDHLHRMRFSQVWLQVRDDNPAAHQLYHSTGFVDQVVRTTWRIKPGAFNFLERGLVKNTAVVRRNKAEWKSHKKWLLNSYPKSIRWNLPVDFSRFEPGLLQKLSNVLEGVFLKHWIISTRNECLGVITWQKTNAYANNLWLAFPEDVTPLIFSYGLQEVIRHLPRSHPISIDYPKGWFAEEFKQRGFTEFRSLIWMKQNLN